MKRAAPRSTLRSLIKRHKPQLRLAANADLLRLAEEARANAFKNKSKIIKSEHTIAAAKWYMSNEQLILSLRTGALQKLTPIAIVELDLKEASEISYA